MAFDFDITGNTKLDTNGFTNGISSMTVAAGTLIADFVKSATSKMAELVTSSVDIGASFETALAKVSTIADTGKVSVGELSKQILDTSDSMGVAAADIAEAAYQAISAGQDTANAVAFAGQASKLAAAGFTSSSAAVDILTTALNAYGMSAEQTTHVSDVLLTTQNLGKTSVNELASSMGRVIPLAAAYGVTVENLSSGLAVLTANGIATAEATTYTKSMLNELGDAGSTVGKILQQQTGKGFAQLNAEGKSLGDVLQILYDSVDGDSTAFAGLWSSVEAGTGALSLASGGAEHFNDVLSQMQNSAGATETAYETMTDTFQHKVDTLQTAAQNLGITLFDSLEPALSDAAQWGTDCITKLTTALSEDGPEAMLAAAGEIISDLAGSIVQQLPSLMQSGVEIIDQLATGIVEATPQVLSVAASVLGALVQGLSEVLPQLVDTGIQMISQLGEGLKSGLPDLMAQAMPVVADFASGLRENVGQIVDAGIELILNLAQGIADGLPTLIEYLPGIVSDIAGIINDNAPKLLMAGVQLIVTLGKGLLQAVPTLVANIPQIIQAIVDVWSAFNWLDLGAKAIKLLSNGITGMVGAVSNAGKSIADSIVNAIKNLPDTLANLGKVAMYDLQGAITGAIGASKVAALKIVSGIETSFNTLPAHLLSIGKNAIQGLINGIAEMAGAVVKSITGVVSGTVNTAKGILGIHSPSKVFDEIGLNICRGLAEGLTINAPLAEDAAKQVVASVTSTTEALTGSMQTVTETVTEILKDGTTQQKQVITEVYDDVVDGALVTIERVKTIAADGTVQVAEQVKKSSADTFDGLWKELQTEADAGVLGTFDDLYTAVKNQDWLSVGKWVANTIYSGLTADQKQQVQSFALGIVDKLNAALGGARDKLVQGAIDLGTQICSGLTGGFSEVWQQAQGLGSTLVSVFQGLQGPLSTAALAISQGLSGGLLSSFPAIFAGVASLVGTIGAAFEGLLAAISAALSATIFGIPMGLVVAAAAVALGIAIAAICSRLGGSKKSSGVSGGGSSGGGGGSGSMGSVDITTGTGSLEDAINANTKALEKTNSALADMIRQAGALVLSDNMRLGSTVAASGTAQVVSAANSYRREGDTNIIQNFYNGHDTAAAQQREARWEADMARRQRR